MLTHPKQPTVLLIEKNPTICKIIQLPLRWKNIEVVVKGNAVDALSFILNEKPAVILLDMGIPDLDAYQFCQIIRSNTQSRHIPLIFLYSTSHGLDRERGLIAESPTKWLKKPFSSKELLQAVTSYLV